MISKELLGLTKRPHQIIGASLQDSCILQSFTGNTSTLRALSTRPDDAARPPPPFYGRPRPQLHPNNGVADRLTLLWQHACTAIADPTRADAVAAVGELTGSVALQQLRDTMQSNPVGRQILQDRPIVSKTTIPYERLLQEANQEAATANGTSDPTASNITFGQAYGQFLAQHGFDPDSRDPIRYIDDPELVYVMLRYRQCHDYWHTLTGLPPTVLGELGLKWLELFQTGLPLAALSATVGSLRLAPHESHVLWQQYWPWAQAQWAKMPYGQLMCVYYEKEFDTPLAELQSRIGLKPAPR